jgi:hypothetical protein
VRLFVSFETLDAKGRPTPQDVVQVQWVGFRENGPCLDDGRGRVDECSIHVEEDRFDIDVDNVGVLGGGHGARLGVGE